MVLCAEEAAQEENKKTPPFTAKQIYVIPVKGDIDPAILYVIRRGIKEAIEAEADAVILHMDTYGGRVDSTDEIYSILKKFPEQDRLITYIDDRAGSAGAFISVATRHIYMAESSVIGAADVVMMAPGGGAAEIPEDYQEKLRSFVKGLVRATGERQGHNVDVLEAMIDPNLELVIDEEVISKEGSLLTLTNLEAEKTYGKEGKPLLSAGTFASLEAFTDFLGNGSAVVTTIEPSGFEKIGQFIVMLSPFLLSAAFILGYAEFQTQGFGVLGALAALCVLLFFFGHTVAGLTGQIGLVFFFLGALLVLVELFFLPGTLVIGVGGFLLMIIGLLKSMIDSYPGDPVLPTLPQMEMPIAVLGQTFLISAIGIVLLVFLLPKTRAYSALVLDATAGTTTSSSNRPLIEIGQTGISQTILRPSGTAVFNDQPVDVVTEGDFIEPGTPISVVEVRGSTIVVEQAT